jgi:hypothetical protein
MAPPKVRSVTLRVRSCKKDGHWPGVTIHVTASCCQLLLVTRRRCLSRPTTRSRRMSSSGDQLMITFFRECLIYSLVKIFLPRSYIRVSVVTCTPKVTDWKRCELCYQHRSFSLFLFLLSGSVWNGASNARVHASTMRTVDAVGLHVLQACVHTW